MNARLVTGVLAAAMAAALTCGCRGGGAVREDQSPTALIPDLESGQPVAATPGLETPAPQPRRDMFQAVAIRFGRFTGGIDSAGNPGDRQLKVILEPVDADGDVVKRGGSLRLDVYTMEGGKPRLLKQWDWTADQLAETWLSGFGLYYYVLKLDWPGGAPPKPGKLLLRATFTTLSGDRLTAEKTISLVHSSKTQAPAGGA